MTSFVATKSPVTGKQEWILQDDDYDFHQEIARSAYADMLHDTERNQKYFSALREAIELMHQRGKPANVLDIGTGTGLLSMMAVRSGADTVTACEAFGPMAGCARQVVKDNGCADIRIIPKRSTEISVGPDGDMEQRANILVTEVFDTELIGEGAIPTFNHAHKELLEKDCIVVPTSATMYVQVVQSEVARNWSRFQAMLLPNGKEINPPADLIECPGSISVHDLQMDQMPPDWFVSVSEPVAVFQFDFSGKEPIKKYRHAVHELKAATSGRCDAIFMWWDLQMDTKKDIMLSCAPGWEHPEGKQIQWRDHWMQAVYYPQKKLQVDKGQDFTLLSCHDEYSLWFDVQPTNQIDAAPNPPACRCGAHIACSWTRLGMMNDPEKNQRHIEALQRVVNEDSVCLSISDGSLLPLMAASLGAKKVYALESHPACRSFVERYVKENNLHDKVKIISKEVDEIRSGDIDNEKINVLIGEPFFYTSTLPWHNLLFWYCRSELDDLLAETADIIPGQISIKAVAIDFDDLWKIRAPVNNCEGFDLNHFDKMIHDSSNLSDAYLEPQPLWEYPGVPLSDQFDILNLDFTRPLSAIKTIERSGFIKLWGSGTCNGVAVWADFHLDHSTSILSGLLEPPSEGQKLHWDIHNRQAVHIFPTPTTIPEGESHMWCLKHKVNFRPKVGQLDFKFEVVKLPENESDG